MDTHMPELTVRESLLFSAKLRQPQSVPLAEKEA
jgi:ATP-binding cassette, subfamily G (WHITE), member 2, SNQ2